MYRDSNSDSDSYDSDNVKKYRSKVKRVEANSHKKRPISPIATKSKTGPVGPRGPVGPQGPQGPQGQEGEGVGDMLEIYKLIQKDYEFMKKEFIKSMLSKYIILDIVNMVVEYMI